MTGAGGSIVGVTGSARRSTGTTDTVRPDLGRPANGAGTSPLYRTTQTYGMEGTRVLAVE